jgi:hypothetical protein
MPVNRSEALAAGERTGATPRRRKPIAAPAKTMEEIRAEQAAAMEQSPVGAQLRQAKQTLAIAMAKAEKISVADALAIIEARDARSPSTHVPITGGVDVVLPPGSGKKRAGGIISRLAEQVPVAQQEDLAIHEEVIGFMDQMLPAIAEAAKGRLLNLAKEMSGSPHDTFLAVLADYEDIDLRAILQGGDGHAFVASAIKAMAFLMIAQAILAVDNEAGEETWSLLTVEVE